MPKLTRTPQTSKRENGTPTPTGSGAGGAIKATTKLLLLVIVLAGCGDVHLSNREIIEKTKECADAGMSSEYKRAFDGGILDVQCGPVKP